MFRYQIIYTISLIASFLFYMAYSPWFSWYLFVFILLLVPLDFLISLPGMLTKTVKLSAPVFLEKNAEGYVRITAANAGKRMFPVRCLYTQLRVTGDDFNAQFRVSCPAAAVGCYDVEIDTAQTGLTVFEVKQVRAVSLLGLFSRKFEAHSSVSVLILPTAQKPQRAIELPRSLALRPKPGGGFSEEHEMRAYRPGDPVRSVHWKLSAKFDSLIIREPLVPPKESRLVYVLPWENAAQRDSSLAHLRWAAAYLFKMDATFHLKIGDGQLVEEIIDEAALIAFLRRALDKSLASKPVRSPSIARFSWVYKIGR